MKIYAILAITFLMMTGAISAQHVNIGIKGSFNLYTIQSDNNSQTDQLLGYNLSLLGHIHLTTHLGLQPEIVY